MSGHSKWATTKHQKAAADAKRSNLFTKISNMISVAARAGGDPTMNFQLRLAMDKARSANMPKDRIEKAIKRGTGELGGARIEETLYEAYGPSGTAILIEVLSDNRNRAASEIKSVLNKLGGKLAGSGAVSYLFERNGEIKVSCQLTASSLQPLDLARGKQGKKEETEETIINSGAQDYEKIDDGYLVYCVPNELSNVKNFLHESGLEMQSADLVFKPKTTVDLDEEASTKVIKMLHALDDLDDVANVSSNLG